MPKADGELSRRAHALGNPNRYEIFRLVARARPDVGIEELTRQLAINHNAVRQHLKELEDAGLVEVRTARSGRPGRPALRYRLAPHAAGTWDTDGPYRRLSMLLLEVLREGRSAVEVGREAGRALEDDPSGDEPVTRLVDQIARDGFDPRVASSRGGHAVVFGRCPYADAALADPGTVCALHRGLAQGLAEAVGAPAVVGLEVKDPRRAGCRLFLAGDP